MTEKWQLKTTDSINQMLRVRNDLSIDNLSSKYEDLLLVKHQFHIADDIMFPDPACLAFFTAFEENHLSKFEESEVLKVFAVDIHEGSLNIYIYCKDAQKSVYDCIEFLKSNPLFKCEFEIVLKDKGNRVKSFV